MGDTLAQLETLAQKVGQLETELAATKAELARWEEMEQMSGEMESNDGLFKFVIIRNGVQHKSVPFARWINRCKTLPEAVKAVYKG